MAATALLVGINKYTDRRIKSLRGCEQDVEAMRQTLIDTQAFGLNELSIFTITDSSKGGAPTRYRIMQKLSDALGHASSHDTFVFYYAGHGTQRGMKPYIQPRDFSPDSPALSCIPLSDVMIEIRERKITRRVVIMDSCYSGIHPGMRTTETSSTELEEYRGALQGEFVAKEGIAVLSASCMDQQAREEEAGGATCGIYTSALCDAFRDLAKRKTWGRNITVEDLHAYVHDLTIFDEKNREEQMRKSNPQNPRSYSSIGPPIVVYQAELSKTQRKETSQAEVSLGELIESLAWSTPDMRRAAADKIVADYGPEAVSRLIKCLDADDDRVREMAAYALGQIRSERSIRPLFRAMRNRLKRGYAPHAPGADDALMGIGPDVLGPGIHYLQRDAKKLDSHSRRAILRVLIAVWDGRKEPKGATMVNLIVREDENLLAVCKPTRFVIDFILERLPKHLESERDQDYRVAPYGRRPTYALLRFCAENGEGETALGLMREHALYGTGFHFTRLALATAAAAPAALGLRVTNKILLDDDKKCLPVERLYLTEEIGDHRSLHMTAEHILEGPEYGESASTLMALVSEDVRQTL